MFHCFAPLRDKSRTLSKRLFGFSAGIWLALGSAACGSATVETDRTVTGALADESGPANAPQLCVGVRGNGNYLITHFDAFARIVEHYGVIDGVAGGSSASISAFVYESMLKNPALRNCGTTACSEEIVTARLSLLLRSILGYAREVYDSEDGLAVRGFADSAQRLKSGLANSGFPALLSFDTLRAAEELTAILSSSDIRSLINPEIFATLADVPHLAFNVKEIYKAITAFADFDSTNDRIFFRNGIINWPDAARLFGRVGDFYAGYGPADQAGMQSYLETCAVPSLAKTWDQAVAAPAGSQTCGALFGSLVRDYRARMKTAEGTFRSRLDESVGDTAVMMKIISTSVLEAPAVATFNRALNEYKRGTYPEGTPVPFPVNFNDIRFGYWGNTEILDRIAQNRRGYTDEKTAKFTELGDDTWRRVLSTSPAEPSLSRLVTLPDGRISGGGWSDLSPVLVLRNAGCKQVVLASREGEEATFATGVASLFGMTPADHFGLYDLSNPNSGYSKSVTDADGVLCTNWDSYTAFQIAEMGDGSYLAPFETQSPFFTANALRPDPAITPRTGKPGCTPGVTAPPRNGL